LTDKVKKALQGNLIICIKDAIDFLPEYCDFHIYNSDYVPGDRKYLSPLTTRITIHKDAYTMASDIHFALHPEQGGAKGKKGLAATVSAQKNFTDWELSKVYKRPWGPGVMSEIGIYLPVHLGCKRIVVIGWDLNPDDLRHYYDKSVKDREKYLREGKLIMNSIPALLTWMRSIGVEFYLCSPKSALPITQVKMEDVL
jgi:hypothetical protein